MEEDSDRLVEIAVIGSGGQPAAGHSVTLALEGDGSPAGHAHPDSSKMPVDMPPGSISAQPTTVSTGVDTILYSADLFSGLVTITASSDSIADASAAISVRFPGLVEYQPTGDEIMVGDNDKHPDNHFGSSSMVAALASLAEAHYARYGVKLWYNDISLAWGGKFTWPESVGYGRTQGHHEHSAGEAIDVQTINYPGGYALSLGENQPTVSGRWLMMWWGAQGGAVHDESDDNHYHLRLPGDSRR
ncbi:MAG: hypothetical protein RLN75_02865 [Longimicrobiales bacterium]